MHHDTPLITTIVAGLVLAFIFGMIANRFKMPPLVGYLFAGILVGPHTPGFVADQAIGAELAEIGVILLMFGVGLHFSLKDLLSVRAIAIPGAVVQILCATLLGAGLGTLMGWDLGASLLFGLALSTASTVVLLKAMQDRRLIETERGRIAVGWLIVEDLAMVLALVLIPALASLGGADTGVHDPFVSFVERILGASVGIWGILGLTIVKVAAFVGFMLIVGRRIIPWALHATAHTGSRELFRLAVLSIALGVALGSAVLFGVSLALGAFFAGMILAESELSHRAAQETLPLRDAFAVLFFVSVGMLFDPSIVLSNPLPLIATVFIIMIGKSAAALGIVLLFKRPVSTALTISASLAQIGEFSFILASMGVALAIMPSEGQSLILAGALISIVLNPIVFWAVDLAKPRLEARVAARKAAKAEGEGVRIEPGETTAAAAGPITTDAPGEAAIDIGAPGADDDTPEPTRLADHTVLVGFGQVGRIIADGLQAAGAPLLVIEDSDKDVAAARAAGLEVIFGNAAAADVLRLANIEGARSLMVAISNGFEAGTVCESGRKLNPSVRIVARAYSEDEDAHLRSLGANIVIRGEREIGMGMLAYARSDASTVQADVPAEPKLPAVENLLEKAAAIPAVEVAAAAAMVAANEAAAIVVAPEATAPSEATTEATVEEVAVIAPVVDLEASQSAGVMPEIGEAPAEIDEVVLPLETEPTADVAETPAEAAAEIAEQASDETSEGGIAPPEPDNVVEPQLDDIAAPEIVEEIEAQAEAEADVVAEVPDAAEVEPEATAPVDGIKPEGDDTPDGVVPPVVPEPKS